MSKEKENVAIDQEVEAKSFNEPCPKIAMNLSLEMRVELARKKVLEICDLFGCDGKNTSLNIHHVPLKFFSRDAKFNYRESGSYLTEWLGGKNDITIFSKEF